VTATKGEWDAARWLERWIVENYLFPEVGVIAADGGVDFVGRTGGGFEDQGAVLFLDGALGELPDERAVGLVVLGDDEEV
jgi:hypothetical protein